jgi:hypothetical protein
LRLTQAPQHFASQRLHLGGKSPRSLEELQLPYPQCGVDKPVVLTLTAAVVRTERGSPMATLMVT